MVAENVKENVDLPEGVTAELRNGSLAIKGPKGELIKNFLYPKIKVSAENSIITFTVRKFTKNEKKILNTYVAHLKNMIKGVTEGHEYKLKICSGHFPMNVSLKGSTLEVKNFIGESVPRNITFKENVEVKLNGDIIVVTGIDKELVAQSAASIERLTRRNGFDRRVFQDGIYIIKKDGREIV